MTWLRWLRKKGPELTQELIELQRIVNQLTIHKVIFSFFPLARYWPVVASWGHGFGRARLRTGFGHPPSFPALEWRRPSLSAPRQRGIPHWAWVCPSECRGGGWRDCLDCFSGCFSGARHPAHSQRLYFQIWLKWILPACYQRYLHGLLSYHESLVGSRKSGNHWDFAKCNERWIQAHLRPRKRKYTWQMW